MTHNEAHPLAGKTVILKNVASDPREIIKDGVEFRVEDWVDRLGKSWKMQENWATAHYSFRQGGNGNNSLPSDDEVVYGKIGSLGHCIHNSELGDQV